MDVDVLFAGAAVTDFEEAQTWYERFFGRAPGIVAKDEEVMWQLTGAGWLYIVRDTQYAGNSIVAVAVSDIERTTYALEARGLATGPIEQEGETSLKALVGTPTATRSRSLRLRGAGREGDPFAIRRPRQSLGLVRALGQRERPGRPVGWNHVDPAWSVKHPPPRHRVGRTGG
jgi:hypothetical protein